MDGTVSGIVLAGVPLAVSPGAFGGLRDGLHDLWEAHTLLVGGGILLMTTVAAWAVARLVVLSAVRHVISRTRTALDDVLIERKVLRWLAQLAPAIVVYLWGPRLLGDVPARTEFLTKGSIGYLLVVGALCFSALLNAAEEIYRRTWKGAAVPVRGFVQALKILLFFVTGVFVLAQITDRDPSFFLGSIGALTAVLLLVFKDTILGFVAGVQIAANRMVRPGDWIEMPQAGADGDVIEVSLTTVKVQNWDKTIATIPTYSLISQSFRNWRGMTESGGRRIKRSLRIDASSVRFCDEAALERYSRIQYIQAYLDEKNNELEEYNREHSVDDSSLVNGRRLTNIGTFRAYVAAYLDNHPDIHPGMTRLVRQLPPDERGIPIEIYAFSRIQDWKAYEGIQADIFDHLIAVVPLFDLRLVQIPTGEDVRLVASPAAADRS